MKLSQMFENAPEIEIAGLCIDSRCAKANDMYFCMEGMVHDGHEFIDDVIEKGVKCIVHSKPVDDMQKRGSLYSGGKCQSHTESGGVHVLWASKP